MEYEAFLKSKIKLATKEGFTCNAGDINPALKPHNKLMVEWMVNGGRRACFAAFGLHKTVTQLEAVRLVLQNTGGRGLIICPLSVRAEFIKDAKNILGWQTPPKFIRRIEEAEETGIYLTNYQTVRDGKLDPRLFNVASLDEASVLRGFGGTKTFREFMRLFTGDGGPLGNRKGTLNVPYRFVATATPSPNDYIELLAYADFLGIMDVSQAKTRFFKRDSTKADHLTLHAHKEEEFWLWVASWALFVQQPSDITGNPEELKNMEADAIFQTFKAWTESEVYNYEHHVRIGEELELMGKLPSGFMLLQPQSWSNEVWADITRMLTLNGTQWSKGKEMHLCPMQFDIADRVIRQMSNPGDVVLDPFGGLMTVPYRAILQGRYGYGVELNPSYFLDGAGYCKGAEYKINIPSLFDVLEEEAETKELTKSA